MDVIASVAMSTELPNLKILTRKPNNQNENIISKVFSEKYMCLEFFFLENA